LSKDKKIAKTIRKREPSPHGRKIIFADDVLERKEVKEPAVA